MLYKYKEYSNMAFGSPMLKMQEKIVVEKIFKLLNSKKYNSIDEIKKGFANYKDFIKKNNLEIPIKMFGNTLTEENYNEILSKIEKLINEKNRIDESMITTQNINNDEFGIVQTKETSIVLNNSNGNDALQERMKDVQNNYERFKTDDAKKNTENIAREFDKKKTESLNLQDLNQIIPSNLNSQQLEYYNFALILDKEIKLDVDKGVIFDPEQNKIFKIIKQNEILILLGDNDEIIYTSEEKQNSKLVLLPNNKPNE